MAIRRFCFFGMCCRFLYLVAYNSRPSGHAANTDASRQFRNQSAPKLLFGSRDYCDITLGSVTARHTHACHWHKSSKASYWISMVFA
ncbi:hypothetical protein EV702DRAFT_1085567 [Suillus placidus]|uniref:Secreted protein n=1 Tax=Suillus placidus TaxID=48579 RepID=A0A9P6ZZE3_9AGAM|nr:hypothetical protein EV702DRAFT_1085567 [Suillus placidus]